MVLAALHRANLQARSTQAPLAGLEWLEQTHYDLVLLDVEMPGMDGFGSSAAGYGCCRAISIRRSSMLPLTPTLKAAPRAS